MVTKRVLPVQLTDRDLHILQSVEDGHYLTVEELEWLHVPSWRERWERWSRRTADGSSGRQSYKSSTSFRKRLRQLEAAGFILRVKRPLTVGQGLRRDGDLYALRSAGAALLATYGENAPDKVQGEEPGVPLVPLAHSCELGQVYAALRAAMATTPGVRMEAWGRAPHLVTEGGGATAVQPDACFRLITPEGEFSCFVELDRGCSTTMWQAKVRAYTALQQAGVGEATTRMMVLTITHTRSQRARLMEATAQVLERPSDAYLFGVLDDAHPSRVGRWLTITGGGSDLAQQFSQPGTRSVITTAPYTLF